jgi:hypothetical protein
MNRQTNIHILSRKQYSCDSMTHDVMVGITYKKRGNRARRRLLNRMPKGAATDRAPRETEWRRSGEDKPFNYDS